MTDTYIIMAIAKRQEDKEYGIRNIYISAPLDGSKPYDVYSTWKKARRFPCHADARRFHKLHLYKGDWKIVKLKDVVREEKR